jgi:hypothetical protein
MYHTDAELLWMSRERSADLLRLSSELRNCSNWHRLARRARGGTRSSGQRLASWMGTQLILLGQRLKEGSDG